MSRRRPPSRPRSGIVRPQADVVETKADGAWNVRRLTGSAATKTYTCPGCLRPIAPATPHVLAWPVLKALLSDAAIDERRHWHTACWQRRH